MQMDETPEEIEEEEETEQENPPQVEELQAEISETEPLPPPIIKENTIWCAIRYDLETNEILDINHDGIRQIILEANESTDIISRIFPRSTLVNTFLRSINSLALENAGLKFDNNTQRQVNYNQSKTTQEVVMQKRQHSGITEIQQESWVKENWRILLSLAVIALCFGALYYLYRANPAFSDTLDNYLPLIMGLI